MRKTGWMIFVTLSFCLFFAGNVLAGPVLDRIQQRGELVVGTSGTQPPLTVKAKNGDIIGMDMDMATSMSVAMGVRLKKVQMPFSELLSALKAGKVDMIISGMTMTPKRNMDVAFVGPYHISGKGILTKADKVQMMQNPENINTPGFRLVALRGSTSQMIAEKVLPEAKLIPTKTLDKALDMLIKGQADALIADYPTCAFMAFRHQDQNLAVGESRLSYEPLGIAVADGDPLLVNWVENYLGILRTTGQMKALKKKWFAPGPWVKELP